MSFLLLSKRLELAASEPESFTTLAAVGPLSFQKLYPQSSHLTAEVKECRRARNEERQDVVPRLTRKLTG